VAFDYSDWVSSNLERAKPSAHGEWTAVCPECGRFGAFYVNCSDEGEGPFVCFKCGFSGKRFAPLIAKVEGITLPEALRIMAKKSVDFRRRDTVGSLKDRIRAIRETSTELDWDAADPDEVAARAVDFALPKGFVPCYDKKRDRWFVPDYLTERNFYRETLRDLGIGYVAKGTFMGLDGGKPVERYMKRRIVIPIDCPNGRSWTARAIDKDVEPKYRNPDGADHSRLLIGWNTVATGADFALVEGPLDHAMLYQHEIPSMATGGKELSLAQLGMLFKRPPEARVVVMYDPDALKQAYSAAQQLIVHYSHVYVARLPAVNKRGEKCDPGNSSRKSAHRWFDDAERFTGERGRRLVVSVTEMLERASKRYS
jgi:hypothetical protein